MSKHKECKTEAIILRSYDIKEYDRLYVIFSKQHGLLKIVGIGTRKASAKLASGLEPLTKSEIFLVGCRGLDKAKGVIVHDQYKNIRGNLEALAIVRKIFTAVEALAPEMESAEEVYKLLCHFLDFQNGKLKRDENLSIEERLVLQAAMFWKIVKWAGYEPCLFHCCLCHGKIQEEEKYDFLVPEGVVCKECSSKGIGSGGIGIGKNAVKLLRLFLQKDLETILKIKISKEVFRQTQKATKTMAFHVTRKGNIF